MGVAGSARAAIESLDSGGAIRHVARLASREGRATTWPQWADSRLIAAYRALGIVGPWVHQRAAADALHSGRHTVIATGTGSGKSLPAWLCALGAILEREGGSSIAYRRPTTLYLAPTKALAADQCEALGALIETIGDGAGVPDPPRIATVDGDTPFEARDWARGYADIVLTNPDFLHITLLPQHRRWARLLRSLKYVVVDELHAYRGVSGAHVALIVRRLLRLARHLGADPTVLTMSATARDPATTAARLVGVGVGDVVEITEDTSPAGARTVVFWHGERAATTEASYLLAALVRERLRTLAFVRSRVSAEYVAGKVRELLGVAAPVAAYRGGYLPEERRELERQLREGELVGLATTNALELGIDISGLDAVLTAGWPGSRASFWQQAGRAGRAGADGLAVFVASTDPLDSYLASHPDALLGSPVEAGAFDPANPYILGPHLAAAAHELPLTAADFPLFGLSEQSELLARLVGAGLLKRRPTGWYWNISLGATPQSQIDIRGSGGEAQVVERLTGAVIGTVPATSIDSTLHPGAVYTHQGRVFVVEDLEDRVALARAGEPGYRTRTRSEGTVRVLSREKSRSAGFARFEFGEVEVTSQVTGYDRLLLPELEIVGHYQLDFPERVHATKATWWHLPREEAQAAGLDAARLAGALHAAEHAAIGLLPVFATCDRADIGGLSAADHPDTGAPTVFVYDGVMGGAGFAERGFEAVTEWLRATRDLLVCCPCEAGCPSCVVSPKCGTGNAPLDKAGAVSLLTLVLEGPEGAGSGVRPGG